MEVRTPEHYRKRFTKELCSLVGCDESTLPASVSKEVSASYLGLTNPKTLSVWKATGRHGIVVVKVGRNTQCCTDWLVDMKMRGLSLPGEVA